MIERFDVSLNTPAGQLTTGVEVPTSFVPVTAIVPLMRRLGEQTQALEERRMVEAGQAISCRKGCAACCRMLVPVSAPEAFALHSYVESLPEERRQVVHRRVEGARARLEAAGLVSSLTDLSEANRPLSDVELEPTNRAYYSLRIPCPFLENEVCSIYEERPAACRELLVTSPAELCQDLIKNPVQPIPVSVRVSTVLGLLWGELTGDAARLIPLPLALDWAERHKQDNQHSWRGTELLDKALDKIWRLLSQEFEHRRSGDK